MRLGILVIQQHHCLDAFIALHYRIIRPALDNCSCILWLLAHLVRVAQAHFAVLDQAAYGAHGLCGGRYLCRPHVGDPLLAHRRPPLQALQQLLACKSINHKSAQTPLS